VRIAICTLTAAPDDVSVWSGTPAHLVDALRSIHDDVVTIGPLLPWAFTLLNRLSRATRRYGRKVNWEVEPAALRLFTLRLNKEIRQSRPDVVILMGWFPRGATSVPIVYWGDATIGQRLNAAPHWTRLSKRTSTAAPRVESESLRPLARTMWASRWAQDDAITRYGLTNTELVPFGSNIADPRSTPRRLRDGGPFMLLAVGVQWHRKGIDRAVEAAAELVARGIPVHLHVVGVLPPDESWQRSYVTYHGFLSKSVDAEARALDGLYRAADVFVLPTRLEPFGIVFQEAAAYALPVVTARVGGVPEIVDNGVTGITLRDGATAPEYADAVARLVNDPALYAAMSAQARRRYEESFTWTTVAERVVRIASDVVGQAR
jgi:glycosyltransferase involved in cell wall biosynthesis